MHNHFQTILGNRLNAFRERGLLRTLRPVSSPQGRTIQIAGRQVINFSSNDYLGLAGHPALIRAAQQATFEYGAGSGASRLISGSIQPHHALERALADFKGTAAALHFSSGYAAALGVIPALVGAPDLVIIDKLCHASIVDAARLSRAKLRVFRHNDLEDLEKLLQWSRRSDSGSNRAAPENVLVVTESVFSMDGDRAPLREIADLKDTYGAWLMVDEAHATGIFGPNRRGLADELGLSERVEVQMGTLGKALGVSGGFISGGETLIEYLVNSARTFIFSTAAPPGVSAAAAAAVALVRGPEGELRARDLWRNIHRLAKALGARAHSAILPLIIGDERNAVAASETLLSRGIFAPAIRYPTVRRGLARLRLSLTASHTPEDIDLLVRNLQELELTQRIASTG